MRTVVDPEAATWIIDYLNLPSYKATNVRQYGVATLVVKDLKMLWRAIEPMLPHIRMKSQASKNKWADAVCMALNTPGLLRCLPPTPTHQSYVPVRPCANGMPPPPMNHRMPNQQTQDAPPVFVPSALAETTCSLLHQPLEVPSVECPFERSLQDMFGDSDIMPPPIATPMTNSSSSSNSGCSHKRKREETHSIKMEPGVYSSHEQQHCDLDGPCTLEESAMIEHLRQMGFNDEQEMLAGIRHVSSQEFNKRIDDAMMWIVQQREEAEEAKKVDAVRMHSELLRKEQAELKQKHKKERLDAATMHEWATEREFFQGSVVLDLASPVLELLRQNHEQLLVEFLELEKSARKWFGPTIPHCYFVKRSMEWSSMDIESLASTIMMESTVIQTAMFALSEQQGGVPKVFLLATKEFKDQGLPTGPYGNDDNDEVIVVEKCIASDAKSPNNKSQPAEVIEIDSM